MRFCFGSWESKNKLTTGTRNSVKGIQNPHPVAQDAARVGHPTWILREAPVISVFRSLVIFAAFCLTHALVVAQTARQHGEWHARFQQELPLMGHRNWIAIVDSAYPLQISPGVETIETGSDQLDVVRRVLHEVGESKHVRPVVFTDAELKSVAEDDAAGVTYYRDSLNHFLEEFNDGKTELHSLPHEEIISKLDDAGKTFHVLVLKSTLTIPYTSVFVRLDCGYWSDEQEKRLREKMGRK
jgi:hypothetical protein